MFYFAFYMEISAAVREVNIVLSSVIAIAFKIAKTETIPNPSLGLEGFISAAMISGPQMKNLQAFIRLFSLMKKLIGWKIFEKELRRLSRIKGKRSFEDGSL